MRKTTIAAFAAAAAALASAHVPSARGGEPKLLIHGNYCGPGNNAPSPPVDAVDAACARHDACTPTGGLPSPACNARLRRDLMSVARDPSQPDDMRALAQTFAAGTALIPSAPGGAVGGYAPAPSAYVGRPGRYPGETLPAGSFEFR